MRPKALFLVVILAVSFGGSADGQNSRQWIGTTNPDNVVLLYGTPRTDDVVINFTCDRAKKTIKVAYTFEPAGAKSGMRVDVELSSDGGKVLLSATGLRLEMDDSFLLEATTSADVGLRRTLTEGRTLLIRVQERVEAFPLGGAGKQASDLIAACS